MIEPYNYNDEPSGRSETLVQALERCERLEKQLKIAKKYLSLIKRNVSVGSLAYTYVANAQTEIKELDKWLKLLATISYYASAELLKMRLSFWI